MARVVRSPLPTCQTEVVHAVLALFILLFNGDKKIKASKRQTIGQSSEDHKNNDKINKVIHYYKHYNHMLKNYYKQRKNKSL